MSGPDALPADLAALRERAVALGPTVSDRAVVFGVGDPRAALVLVGEAPGEQEEKLGRPFIGRAGRLLDKALEVNGIDRAALWITNTVKQRPVVIENGRTRNRPPRASEIRAWAPILAEEIELIRPRVILCLGAPAAGNLIGKEFRLSQQRGEWFDGPAGSRVAATYHPSYVLRLVGEAYDRAWAALRDDLAAAWRLAAPAGDA